MLLSKTQAERMGSNMGPDGVMASEEKRPQIYLSGPRGGKSLYFRRLADAAIAEGKTVGEFYRDPVDGKCKLRPYKPDGRKARAK